VKNADWKLSVTGLVSRLTFMCATGSD